MDKYNNEIEESDLTLNDLGSWLKHKFTRFLLQEAKFRKEAIRDELESGLGEVLIDGQVVTVPLEFHQMRYKQGQCNSLNWTVELEEKMREILTAKLGEENA